MKLYKYSLLKESLKSAREKYLNTGLVSQEMFGRLAELDPSKTKKYLEWSCKAYLDFPRLNFEVLPEFFKLFEKAVKSKFEMPSNDINYYSPREFNDLIVNFKAHLERVQEEKNSGAKRIFENDKCYIYYITKYKASCRYGANTHWCVTMRDSSSYWKEYSLFNLFFFLIDKQSSEKYALTVNLYWLQKLKEKFPINKIQTFDVDDKDVSRNNRRIFSKFNIDYTKFLDIILTTINVDKIRKDKVDKIAEYYSGKLEYIKANTYKIISDFEVSPSFFDVRRGKLIVDFTECLGNFTIPYGLKTLKGCPKKVDGSFTCTSTSLKNLVGGPQEVGGNYKLVTDYNISSLKGCATKIGNDFIFESNERVTSLEGLETLKEVRGIRLSYLGIFSLKGLESLKINSLSITNCENLKDLVGLRPQALNNVLIQYSDALTSLQGLEGITIDDMFQLIRLTSLLDFKYFPKQIHNLTIIDCPNLTSLKGLPEVISGNVYLQLSRYSQLTSLEGLPKEVKGNVIIYLPVNLENIDALFDLEVPLGEVKIMVPSDTKYRSKLENTFGSDSIEFI